MKIQLVCTLNTLAGVNFSKPFGNALLDSQDNDTSWGRSLSARSCPPAGRNPLSTRTPLNSSLESPSTGFTRGASHPQHSVMQRRPARVRCIQQRVAHLSLRVNTFDSSVLLLLSEDYAAFMKSTGKRSVLQMKICPPEAWNTIWCWQPPRAKGQDFFSKLLQSY